MEQLDRSVVMLRYVGVQFSCGVCNCNVRADSYRRTSCSQHSWRHISTLNVTKYFAGLFSIRD